MRSIPHRLSQSSSAVSHWLSVAMYHPAERSPHRKGKLRICDFRISLQNIVNDVIDGLVPLSVGRRLPHGEAEQVGRGGEDFDLKVEIHHWVSLLKACCDGHYRIEQRHSLTLRSRSLLHGLNVLAQRPVDVAVEAALIGFGELL